MRLRKKDLSYRLGNGNTRDSSLLLWRSIAGEGLLCGSWNAACTAFAGSIGGDVAAVS